MGARRLEEIAVGLGIAFVGAVFLWASWDIPAGRSMVGPRSVPAIAAGAFGAGGLLIAGLAAFSAGPPAHGKEHKLLRVVLPAAALAGAAIWLWGALGWTLASLLVAPAFFAIFGARGWKELILFPAMMVGFLYLVFFQLLGLWHGTGWLIRSMGLS